MVIKYSNTHVRPVSRAAKVRKVTDKHTIGKRTWQTCKKNAGSGEGCVVFSSFLTRKPWSIERISKGSCANQGGFVQEMTPSITITTGFWRIYTSDFAVFVFRLLKHPQRKKKNTPCGQNRAINPEVALNHLGRWEQTSAPLWKTFEGTIPSQVEWWKCVGLL